MILFIVSNLKSISLNLSKSYERLSTSHLADCVCVSDVWWGGLTNQAMSSNVALIALSLTQLHQILFVSGNNLLQCEQVYTKAYKILGL